MSKSLRLLWFQTAQTELSDIYLTKITDMFRYRLRMMIWRFAGGVGQIIGMKPLPSRFLYGKTELAELVLGVRCFVFVKRLAKKS